MSKDTTPKILTILCMVSFLIGLIILVIAIHDTTQGTYEYREETGFNTSYGGKVFADQEYIILYERCLDCWLKDDSWRIKDILLKDELRWETRI